MYKWLRLLVNVMKQGKCLMCDHVQCVHLVRVVDGDLQASENLSLRQVFVHGQLKPVLWAVLAVECGRVVVQVHHTNTDCGDGVVNYLVVRSNLRSLDLK